MIMIMWTHIKTTDTDEGAGVLILPVSPLQSSEPDKVGLTQRAKYLPRVLRAGERLLELR